MWGHDVAMIDHLVEEYGLDPNGVSISGRAALLEAASLGRVRTVKHLVEKHNVDIHEKDDEGVTALYLAERYGWTECADYLRALGCRLSEEDTTHLDQEREIERYILGIHF